MTRWTGKTFTSLLAMTLGFSACSENENDSKPQKRGLGISIANEMGIDEIIEKVKDHNKEFTKLNQSLNLSGGVVTTPVDAMLWENARPFSVKESIPDIFSSSMLFSSIPKLQENSSDCSPAFEAASSKSMLADVVSTALIWINHIGSEQREGAFPKTITDGRDGQPFRISQIKDLGKNKTTDLVEFAANQNILQVFMRHEVSEDVSNLYQFKTVFVELNFNDNTYVLDVDSEKSSRQEYKNDDTSEIISTKDFVNQASLSYLWRKFPDGNAAFNSSWNLDKLQVECNPNQRNCFQNYAKQFSLDGLWGEGMLNAKFQDLKKKDFANFGLKTSKDDEDNIKCKVVKVESTIL